MRNGCTVLVAHPSSELYGSDRVLLESVVGLVRAGCTVTVALPSLGPLATEITRIGATVVLCPSPVIRKSLATGRGAAQFFMDTARGAVNGLRLIRSVRPDVVFVNTLTVPLWVALARLSGCRALLHVHEAESSAPRLVRALLSSPALLAHKILVNSTFSRTTMIEAFPAALRSRVEDRTHLLLNGVEGPMNPPLPRKTLSEPFNILYVGRLSQRKGVDLLFEAVALLNARGIHSRLRVVGAVFTGYEWYEKELHERASQADLEGLVEFIGFAPDVWTHYSAADVAVVPSRKDEPFGNTAVEALLALRPVVVSDTTGLKEAAGNYGASRFFAPDDVEDLTTTLAAIHDSWDAVQEFLPGDRDRAIARHSPALYREAVAAETLDLVLDLPA